MFRVLDGVFKGFFWLKVGNLLFSLGCGREEYGGSVLGDFLFCSEGFGVFN